MPCIYVAGNHEVYKGSIKEGLEDGRAAAAKFPNVSISWRTTASSSTTSGSWEQPSRAAIVKFD